MTAVLVTLACAFVLGGYAVVVLHHCTRWELSLKSIGAWCLVLLSGALAQTVFDGRVNAGVAHLSVWLAVVATALLFPSMRRWLAKERV